MSHRQIQCIATYTLVVALVYYICYRWLALPWIDISAGSFPSFAFVFALTLLAPRLTTK